MMINLLMFTTLVLITGCSSAPKAPQVSLTKGVYPIDFQTTTIRNTVIKSQQAKGYWRKQFVYKIDCRNPSPEFFYTTAHADKIIANIRPPFINFIFKKLQEDLRRYGIATSVDLFVVEVEAIEGQPQVILDCIRFGNQSES